MVNLSKTLSFGSCSTNGNKIRRTKKNQKRIYNNNMYNTI